MPQTGDPTSSTAHKELSRNPILPWSPPNLGLASNLLRSKAPGEAPAGRHGSGDATSGQRDPGVPRPTAAGHQHLPQDLQNGVKARLLVWRWAHAWESPMGSGSASRRVPGMQAACPPEAQAEGEMAGREAVRATSSELLRRGHAPPRSRHAVPGGSREGVGKGQASEWPCARAPGAGRRLQP